MLLCPPCETANRRQGSRPPQTNRYDSAFRDRPQRGVNLESAPLPRTSLSGLGCGLQLSRRLSCPRRCMSLSTSVPFRSRSLAVSPVLAVPVRVEQQPSESAPLATPERERRATVNCLDRGKEPTLQSEFVPKPAASSTGPRRRRSTPTRKAVAALPARPVSARSPRAGVVRLHPSASPGDEALAAERLVCTEEERVRLPPSPPASLRSVNGKHPPFVRPRCGFDSCRRLSANPLAQRTAPVAQAQRTTPVAFGSVARSRSWQGTLGRLQLGMPLRA
jgi:hypothetical protein